MYFDINWPFGWFFKLVRCRWNKKCCNWWWLNPKIGINVVFFKNASKNKHWTNPIKSVAINFEHRLEHKKWNWNNLFWFKNCDFGNYTHLDGIKKPVTLQKLLFGLIKYISKVKLSLHQAALTLIKYVRIYQIVKLYWPK